MSHGTAAGSIWSRADGTGPFSPAPGADSATRLPILATDATAAATLIAPHARAGARRRGSGDSRGGQLSSADHPTSAAPARGTLTALRLSPAVGVDGVTVSLHGGANSAPVAHPLRRASRRDASRDGRAVRGVPEARVTLWWAGTASCAAER